MGNFNLPIFKFFFNEIEIIIVIWYNICALILLKCTIKHVFIELIFKICFGMLYMQSYELYIKHINLKNKPYVSIWGDSLT